MAIAATTTAAAAPARRRHHGEAPPVACPADRARARPTERFTATYTCSTINPNMIATTR